MNYIGHVDEELERARDLYPEWPEDIVHQAAIVAEEAGEVVRAALNHHYHGAPKVDIRDELIQTAAMCFRMLEGK